MMVMEKEISRLLVEIFLCHCHSYYYCLVFYLLFEANSIYYIFFNFQEVFVFPNVLANSSVNFSTSVSLSKLPIIGFSLPNFQTSLNTISDN